MGGFPKSGYLSGVLMITIVVFWGVLGEATIYLAGLLWTGPLLVLQSA